MIQSRMCVKSSFKVILGWMRLPGLFNSGLGMDKVQTSFLNVLNLTSGQQTSSFLFLKHKSESFQMNAT